MSLIKSHGDSNAPSKGADTGKESGDAAKLGYISVPFPSERPAASNAEVGITSGSKFTDNQGTSMGSYKHQDKKPDAKTGT